MNVKFVIYITLIFGLVSAVQGSGVCKSAFECRRNCDQGFKRVCQAPTFSRSDGCFCEKIEPDICKTDSDCKKHLPTCDTKTHDLVCGGPKCYCDKHQCSSNYDCRNRVCYMDGNFFPRYPVCNAKHVCECLKKEKDTLIKCTTIAPCLDIRDCPKRTPGKRCVAKTFCYCIQSCDRDEHCIGDASCTNGFCVANTNSIG